MSRQLMECIARHKLWAELILAAASKFQRICERLDARIFVYNAFRCGYIDCIRECSSETIRRKGFVYF